MLRLKTGRPPAKRLCLETVSLAIPQGFHFSFVPLDPRINLLAGELSRLWEFGSVGPEPAQNKFEQLKPLFSGKPFNGSFYFGKFAHNSILATRSSRCHAAGSGMIPRNS